jgi:benzodiazapine receptor
VRYKLLAASLLLPLLVGIFGSAVTLGSISTWYVTLNKPSFSPPNYIFGPVWTTLYVLMGIALYLVLGSNKKKQAALKIFLLQLFLNFLWSLVFFGFHQIFPAF